MTRDYFGFCPNCGDKKRYTKEQVVNLECRWFCPACQDSTCAILFEVVPVQHIDNLNQEYALIKIIPFHDDIEIGAHYIEEASFYE